MSKRTIKYKYDTNFDDEYWMNFLQRELEMKEKFILGGVKSEGRFNEKVKTIFELGQKYNLYIPKLTELHGNCMFESFQSIGLCNDFEKFRVALAYIMYIFKDIKDLIPNSGSTMNELFTVFNEVEFVSRDDDKRLFKYNFDLMCIDLATDTSWTRLNTELVLTFISTMFNIKIIIIHDNGYIQEISTLSNDNTKTIYLGQIQELHYIPLIPKVVGDEQCLMYTEKLDLFHKWAKQMCLVTNNIEIEEQEKFNVDNSEFVSFE